MSRKWRTAVRATAAIGILTASIAVTHCLAQGGTVDLSYPGLASGVLKSATLAPLKRGVLLSADGVEIRDSQIEDFVKGANPQVQAQLKKNLFFVLEQMATPNLLLADARRTGDEDGDEESVIAKHLGRKFASLTVSEEECRRFYEQNKPMMAEAPYDQVKGPIREHILQQKKAEAVNKYVETLGHEMGVKLDAAWVKAQHASAMDNPVDRARRSAVPTVVEFGATGCVPCDMMQPILENLRKKYKDRLNVVFLHVGEEQVLAARFGIQSIPVQAFYDKTGREVYRHTGFFAQAEVEKKLADMGVK